MASYEEEPGGQPALPNLDLVTSPETPYNPELIADNVLWAFVDSKCERDYRRETIPDSDPEAFPGFGEYKNRKYKIVIDADVGSYPHPDDEMDGVSVIDYGLSLRVEEYCPEQLGNIIDMARATDPDSVQQYLELDKKHISQEYKLEGVLGITYSFDSEGDLIIEPYIGLKDDRGAIIWSTSDHDVPASSEVQAEDEANLTEDDPMKAYVEPTLIDDDIERLIIAMTILEAPRSIIQYLERIKRYPEDQ